MKEKKSYTFDEIKQKMVGYCVYQDRCHQEVEQKMREYFLISEAKEKILLYLIQENYLNEERFVRSYIRGKFSIKHWGRLKIKNHLKYKDISEKLIDKCFDEIEESDYRNAVLKIALSYFDSQKGLQNYQKNIKTTKYLISRGFEYEIIKEVLEDIDKKSDF